MNAGKKPSVCLAGACTIQTAAGGVRNVGRDELAAWLDDQKVGYFEVQIHQDTHGRGYDWGLDGPNEKKARSEAKLRVYELRPDVLSVVTAMEILDDARRGRQSIVWFHDGGETFAPHGLGDRDQLKADSATWTESAGQLAYQHLYAYVNGGRALRNELKAMLADAPTIHFVTGDNAAVQRLIYALWYDDVIRF